MDRVRNCFDSRMAKARFSRVMFWPLRTLPEADGDLTPDQLAWLNTARRVCEAYSGELALADPTKLANRVSWLQPMTEQADADLATGGAITATVHVDRVWEGFEMARVQVPHGVAALSPQQRAELVLHTVHGLVSTLGGFRGWDQGVLAAARDAVQARGFEFRWASDWKQSPGRRRQARVVYRLADDGFGRAVLQVREGVADPESVGPVLAYTTPEGFRRSAKTLRWRGPDAVEVVPFCGAFGTESGLIRWTASGGGPAEPSFSANDHLEMAGKVGPAGPSPVEQSPVEHRPSTEPVLVLPGELVERVVVRAVGDDVAERVPEVRVLGGGPTNGVP